MAAGGSSKREGMLCCVSSLSHIRLFATPCTKACQAPLSMGILQEGILEWVAMPSSRGSSQPRDRTHVSHVAGGFFTQVRYQGSLTKGIYIYICIWLIHFIEEQKLTRYCKAIILKFKKKITWGPDWRSAGPAHTLILISILTFAT